MVLQQQQDISHIKSLKSKYYGLHSKTNNGGFLYRLGKKNYVWLISIGVAVLSYKFAKSNKEFYAFVGLLSPALIMFARSKYEKKMRDEKMKIAREKRNSLAQA